MRHHEPVQQTRARRIRTVAVLSWLLATGLTGTIAWRAVAVIDDGAPRTGVLSQPEVAAALASARATARPTTTPTASATPRPSTTAPGEGPSPTDAATGGPTGRPSSTQAPTTSSDPGVPAPPPAPEPAPATEARTWAVAGGTVAASCSGAAITLLYATPQDGWTVEVGSAGPEQVEVELSRDGQETKVRATCVDGVPTQTTSSDGTDGEQPEHTEG